MEEQARVSLVITGLSGGHARLLSCALAQKFQLEIATGSLNDLEPMTSPDSIIISGEFGLSTSARDAAIRLRTGKFIWNPIILLESTLLSQDDSAEWAIWHEELPPDLRKLIGLFPQALPLPEERRRDIVGAALIGLWEGLCQLQRVISGQESVDEGKIRQLLSMVSQLSASDAKVSDLTELTNLSRLAEEVQSAPAINSDLIQKLRPGVVDAERIAREANASNQLRADLHRLSNSLRFAIWNEVSLKDKAAQVSSLLSHLPIEYAKKILPQVGESLIDLRDALLGPLEITAVDSKSGTAHISQSLQSMKWLIDKMGSAIVELRHPGEPIYRGKIQRIVVVEDDDSWRSQTMMVLREISPELNVLSASTVQEAERLLDERVDGTLVLCDLGLPQSQSDIKRGVIDLDAGLKLIQKYSKPGKQSIFMVMTAAENYSDAVRTALSTGIDPADYIQKNPEEWEQQLRSRIWLALNPGTTSALPRVDIFRYTARLIRVNGIEVALEHKPYVLFEYLAANARRWCTLESIREQLTMPGPRDITPVMSKQQLDELDNGEVFTGSNLLTPKHIQDYLQDIRNSVAEAFRAAGKIRETSDLVFYDAERRAYRLQAEAVTYESSEDLSKSRAPRRVLVLEDDPQWHSNIVDRLSSLGFEVRSAHFRTDAEKILDDWVPDMVSLDLQVPANSEELEADECNGIAVMRLLKKSYPEVGIAVLSSIAWKDGIMLSLLREGVSIADYISKQWDNGLDRLMYSIWRLSIQKERGSVLSHADIPQKILPISWKPGSNDTVNIEKYTIRLSKGPAKLLKVLANSPNAPVDRDAIIDALWPPDDLPDTCDDALNTLVRRLRQEITKGTDDQIDGKDLIRSADGVYWIHGILTAD